MRSPLRLGATVALGALLLVGLLASPALAWEWGVSAEAVCEDSGTTVCVLEAGPKDRNPFIHIPAGFMYTLVNPKVNWLYSSEPQAGAANRRIPQPLPREDVSDLLALRPQSAVHNRDGSFVVYRIGDAVASRNIHAAILDAYRLLAREEGVFVEMASAASVAGLLEAGVERGRLVVCTVTGNGLKDPDWALAGAPPPSPVPPDPVAAAAALGLA